MKIGDYQGLRGGTKLVQFPFRVMEILELSEDGCTTL